MEKYEDLEVLTADDVSKQLKISKRTLWRLVSKGDIPKPIKFGGNVRWSKKNMENWIENGCPQTAELNNVRIDSVE